MHAKFSRGVVLAAVLLAGSAAWAVPISSSLSITGSVTLDTGNSFNPVGSAHQSGTLQHVAGGVVTSSSFTDTPSTIGTASLTGGLTDISDGIGAHFSMNGSATASGTHQTDGLFADFLLNLSNNSLTDTFTITFRALITNTVAASGGDAFAFSDISVRDASNVEVLFSDHRVDTVNAGNNLTADSMSNTFSITLTPGASASFSALQRQRGGTFQAGNYSADLNAFLFIDGVTGGNDNNNNSVPVPGSLPLVLLGLLSLVASRRPRRGSTEESTTSALQGA